MSDGKIKKKSRWVRGSGVDRYDKKTDEYIQSTFREADGWYNGARVTRKKS